MAKTRLLILLFILFSFAPLTARAATLSLSPATGSFKIGDLVPVKVIVSSNVPLNAVSGTVFFPTAIFSVESVLKANSIINFWVTEPTINKSSGTVRFEGVSLGGFAGGVGTVVTVNLRANKVGTGTVSFPAGQILANDGQGTDITGNLTGGTFTVVAAPKIEPAKPKPAAPVVKPEAPQPPPTLKAPVIKSSSKYGVSAIAGTSDYPNAQVLLTFIAEGGTKIFITGTADDAGGFVLLVPNSLKRGIYTVTAVMIKADKTNSETSKELVITVGNILSDLGWEIKIILLLLFIISIYLLVKKMIARREAQEAERVLHDSFKALRDDLADKNIGKRDLNQAEKIISKEIKDIESV